ncbi:MAG: CHAT domain-containing protein [Chloroflexota bacterium]
MGRAVLMMIMTSVLMLNVPAVTFSQTGPVATTPGSSDQEADQLRRDGQLAFRERLYSAAITAWERELVVRQDLGDRDGAATTLSNLGVAYKESGQFRRSGERFEQALESWRELGDRPLEATTLNNLGFVYQLQGQMALAISRYQMAWGIARDLGERPLEATSLINLGSAHEALGQVGRAIDVFEQALGIQRELGNRTGEVDALNGLGGAYQRLGQVGRAVAAYDQALAISRDMGDQQGQGISLHNLGAAYEDLGQSARAVDAYEQALAIVLAEGNRYGEGVIRASLGSAYDDTGHVERAIGMYEQALVILREIGDVSDGVRALNGLALAYNQQNRTEQAIDVYEEALAIIREGASRTAEGATLNNLAVAHSKLGRVAHAIELYLQALAIRREVGDRSGEAITLGNLGHAFGEQGDGPRSLAAYRDAVDVFDTLRSDARAETFQQSFADANADVYGQAAAAAFRWGEAEDALAFTERGRARTLLDQVSRGRVATPVGASGALVDQEQILRAEMGAIDSRLLEQRGQRRTARSEALVNELSNELLAKQRTYDDVLARLQTSSPELASLGSVQAVSIRGLQTRLDDATTLLVYQVIGERTLAFLLTSSGLDAWSLPVSGAQLASMVAKLRPMAAGDDSSVALAELHAALVAPIQHQLRTPVVGIVPSGALHYVPFAALRDGERYLGDQYTLFTLPSISVLPFVQDKRKSTPGPAVVLAYDTPAGLAALPHAREEAVSVAAMRGVDPIIGREATESRLRAAVSDARVLHVAAHGELRAETPLFSRLVLGPDAQADGSLAVQEIYGLDLGQADLVVLSACETQGGEVGEGGDLVSLNRAFLAAGAPTVVASLWRVDDAATRVLMEAFHKELLDGRSKAAALQAAQLATRAEWPDPYFWAGFILSGDPGAWQP